MSYPSLAPAIIKRPWLMRWMKPLSEWYCDKSGYRKLGLRYIYIRHMQSECKCGPLEGWQVVGGHMG